MSLTAIKTSFTQTFPKETHKHQQWRKIGETLEEGENPSIPFMHLTPILE